MKSLWICFLFIMCCGMLESCSSVRVLSSKEMPGASFDSYQTFNFMDVSLKNDAMGVENHPGIAMLKAAIERELQERGYTKSDNPDIFVNIGIVTEDKVQTRKTDIREAPVYIGQRRYSWKSQEVVVDRYRVGTVTLDLVDAFKNERIWEGIVQGTLTINPEKLKQRIDEGIERLINRLPASSAH